MERMRVKPLLAGLAAAGLMLALLSATAAGTPHAGADEAAGGAGAGVAERSEAWCAEACHSPMDVYVDTFLSTDEGTTALSAVHGRLGATCSSCHEWDEVSAREMIEAEESGGFKVSKSGYLKIPTDYDESLCLNEACHNMTRQELSEMSEGWAWNVHSDRHGSLECSTCHKAHSESTLTCAQCHEDAQALAEEIGWSWE